MARPSKSTAVLKSEKKSHRTKSEMKQREAAEQSALTGLPLRECSEVENDPTAHAEVVAIRTACEKLKTYDLSGYILYTSCEPCPMCLSAIIWANIKTVYYSGKYEDCQQIGFRDDHIFKFIQDGANDENVVKLELHDNDIAKSMYNMYHAMSGTIY